MLRLARAALEELLPPGRINALIVDVPCDDTVPKSSGKLRGDLSPKAVLGQLRGHRGGGIDLSFVRLADNTLEITNEGTHCTSFLKA